MLFSIIDLTSEFTLERIDAGTGTLEVVANLDSNSEIGAK
jgi:hypothetical protein